ncbi:MAG TPA: AMP-binding protein [Bryobacteraceae bacterium]|nr:AMP-binding protein [Bryobacteraceae bacterium]
MSDPAAEFLKARDFLLTHRSDYETARRDFRWPKLEEFNWALDYFEVMAKGNGRTALWIVEECGPEVQLSFAELSERSNRVANFLRGAGVQRGDRILAMLGNEAALWETQLAAFKLGAVVIPASALLGPEDLRDRLDRGGVGHAIAGAMHADKVEQAQFLGGRDLLRSRISVGGKVPGWLPFEDACQHSARFEPDGPTRATDPLLLYFTSGTTAKPKLVPHTHESYPVGHLSTMYWLGLQPGDVHWNISSPGWAKHAWSCFFAPWNAGATVFTYNYQRFRAKDVLGVLSAKGVTTLCAPPTVWRMLIQEKLADYPVHLRELASAGEPLNPEVIERVEAAWGLTVRDGYGQTETTAMIGNPPGQPVKPGSMGRPLPGYRLECASDGEICVDLSARPAGLMPGYASEAGVTTDPQRGGFYQTGDLALRDEDGYFTYVGRADDVFKASDYRISPFELESALIEHPAVAEAAVVPSPDPVRGFVPKAFLLLAEGYAPGEELARELFLFVRQKLAPYKRIRRIEFSDLPKTISGKIRRAELRKSEQGRSGRGPLEFFEENFRQEG